MKLILHNTILCIIYVGIRNKNNIYKSFKRNIKTIDNRKNYSTIIYKGTYIKLNKNYNILFILLYSHFKSEVLYCHKL